MRILRSICLFLVLSGFFFSCKKDEIAVSQLTINGVSYSLKSGSYSQESGVNSEGTDIVMHHVLLVGPEVTINETTGLFEGTSNVLSFTLITEASEVIPSDIYGVVSANDIPRVVTFAAAYQNYDVATKTAEQMYEITDGIIDVSSSGGLRYGFKFDLIHLDANSNEINISGLFKGVLVAN